jgi:hypothetical protein
MSPEIFNEPSSRRGLLMPDIAPAARAGAGEPGPARSSGSRTTPASSVRGH